MAKKKHTDITVPINKLIDEVNNCLDNNEETKYFQNLALLYSFQENILKWLVFIKICWDKSDPKLKGGGEVEVEEFNKIKNFCSQLSYYQAQNLALSFNVIDLNLYKKIDTVRHQRNNILHDLWLYEHRNNYEELRKELEMLASISNDLMQVFNDLSEEIGVEDIYEMLL